MDTTMVTNVLCACEDVAVATAFEVDLGGGPEVVGAVELAAYISAPMLRIMVEEKLPPPSGTNVPVPFAGVLVVERIPWADDGHPDLTELRRLAVQRAAEFRCTEPEGALERQVAALWAGVLGCSRVGAGDDFLELGGDSFAAITMIAEVEQRYHLELDVFELMDTATVRGLAALLAERGVSPAPDDAAGAGAGQA